MSAYKEWLARLLTDDLLRTRIERKMLELTDVSGGPDSCWIFCGQILPRGYGVLSLGSKVENGKRRQGKGYAHRIAYVLHHNRLPDSDVVLHSCDNPPCCNPHHLSAGTYQDNSMDMARKARGTAKHTPHQAREVIRLTKEGKSSGIIALELGVSTCFIDNVRRGKTWQHATGLTPETASHLGCKHKQPQSIWHLRQRQKQA